MDKLNANNYIGTDSEIDSLEDTELEKIFNHNAIILDTQIPRYVDNIDNTDNIDNIDNINNIDKVINDITSHGPCIEGVECVVCFMPFSDKIIKCKGLKCSHDGLVCQACISQTKVCPICRDPHKLKGTFKPVVNFRKVCMMMIFVPLIGLIIYGLLGFFTAMLFTKEYGAIECIYEKVPLHPGKDIEIQTNNICVLKYDKYYSDPFKCNSDLLKQKMVKCHKHCSSTKICKLSLYTDKVKIDTSPYTFVFIIFSVIATITTIIYVALSIRLYGNNCDNYIYCRVCKWVCCDVNSNSDYSQIDQEHNSESDLDQDMFLTNSDENYQNNSELVIDMNNIDHNVDQINL